MDRFEDFEIVANINIFLNVSSFKFKEYYRKLNENFIMNKTRYFIMNRIAVSQAYCIVVTFLLMLCILYKYIVVLWKSRTFYDF